MEERTNEIMEQNNDVIEVIDNDNEKIGLVDGVVCLTLGACAIYGLYKGLSWGVRKVTTVFSNRKNKDDVECEPEEKVVEISEKKSEKEKEAK